MRYRVTIVGEPVLDIYESDNARCWFVTKKEKQRGNIFLSGYVRCFKPSILAEFRHVPEEALLDMGGHIWKVPEDAWHRCPYVDIIEDVPGPVVVRCGEQCEEAVAYPSYSSDCKEVDEKMDQSIQGKLDKYLDLFEEVKKKTKDERVALTLLQEVSKDRRMEEIREEKEAKNSEPATTKQLNFMRKLGIEAPPGVTKREASMLIDEELGRNGE